MKNFIKTYWKTLLFFAVIGVFGGFFTGIYGIVKKSAVVKHPKSELGRYQAA